MKTKSPQLIQRPFAISEQGLKAIHNIYPRAQELMRGGVSLPNRQSMLCSRRHCAYWRLCEQRWGGEFPKHEARTESQVSGLDSNTTMLGLRIHSLD